MLSTKFIINKMKKFDMKKFYSIELVQTNIEAVSTKFSINK